MYLLFVFSLFLNVHYSGLEGPGQERPGQEGQIAVLPTADHGVFRLIYKAETKQDVSISLYNDKGNKRFEKRIASTGSFLLPIDLNNERSGVYTVKISTESFELEEEFEFVRYEEKIREYFSYEYRPEKHSMVVSISEPIDTPVNVYIYNEKDDELISDQIAANSDFYRVYNLDGAPARTLELRIMTGGVQILDENFDF